MTNRMNRNKRYRLLLVGPSCSGKTALFHRLTKDTFLELTDATIGVDFHHKPIVHEGKPCHLQYWDTAGRQSFRSITESYFVGTNIFLLLYSVASRPTFLALDDWVRAIKDRVNAPIFLVGTHTDRVREVSQEEAGTYALKHGAFWAEVSSKTGDGCAELETRILNQLHPHGKYRLTRADSVAVWEEEPLRSAEPATVPKTVVNGWLKKLKLWFGFRV